jgi:hypothetical protein
MLCQQRGKRPLNAEHGELEEERQRGGREGLWPFESQNKKKNNKQKVRGKMQRRDVFIALFFLVQLYFPVKYYFFPSGLYSQFDERFTVQKLFSVFIFFVFY